ncbi:hypothetical protein BGZ73_005388 [Actinomortierella ambigua]|nr:hypothetical protein BGZ73_005388 [Actinomortierella ambigua]
MAPQGTNSADNSHSSMDNVPPQTILPQLLLSFAEVEFECQPSDSLSVGNTPPNAQLKHTKGDGTIFQLEDVTIITRYLAHLLDLCGNSVEDEATLDMLFTKVDDILKRWLSDVYSKPCPRDKEVFDKFLSGATPALEALERSLTTNLYDGYFLGKRTTYVDLAYYGLIALFMQSYPKSTSTFFTRFTFPLTLKLVERLQSHSRVASILAKSSPWSHHTSSRVLALHDVGFSVTNIPQAYQFYTDTFGFLCVKKDMALGIPSGSLEFELPNSTTKLKLTYLASNVRGSPSVGQGPFTLAVNDVRSMVADLSAKSMMIHTSPQSQSWGTMAKICDPFNNVITIVDFKSGSM